MKAGTRKRERQIWIGGTEKQCGHGILETLTNYAEEPLADVCTLCGIRVAEYADCTGCKKRKRLVRFGPNGIRFCTGQCETIWAKKESARKKSEARQPWKRNASGHVD